MYYLVLFLISTLFLFVNKNSPLQNKRYLNISFVLMLLISAFRGYTVGGDLYNYIPLFEEISRTDLNTLLADYTKYGIVFTCYVKFSSLISSDPTFILFTTSLINLGLVFYFIKKHSCNYWLSIFIYITMAYYTNTFNSVRSSMALAIGMLAVHYLLENKNWKYLLCCIIAIEIHKTILPILFIPLLKKIKPSWIILLIPIVASIFLAQILDLDMIANLLALYSDEYAQMESSGSGYSMLALDIVLTLFAYYCLRHRLNETNSLMINILCMATCIQAFAPVFSLTTRMALFFTVYIIVLLPEIAEKAFTPASRIIAKSVLTVACLVYFQIFVMTPSMMYEDGVESNTQRTIPYYFYWQNPPK